MIKTLAIASIALLAPSVVVANDVCDDVAYMAEQIMTARQSGVPFGKLYAISQKPEFSPVKDLLEEAVIMAYDQPAYSTEQYQQKAIDEFRDTLQLVCVKTLR